MKKTVVLSIRGQQNYIGQEPDVIELVTEGTLEDIAGGWRLHYEETDLTGLQGVNTTIEVQGKTVTLTRGGKLNSQMIFREGESHDSLYRMEFGTLMLTVSATRIVADITEAGGVIDLRYNIEVEHDAAGEIAYHLDIQVKENA